MIGSARVCVRSSIPPIVETARLDDVLPARLPGERRADEILQLPPVHRHVEREARSAVADHEHPLAVAFAPELIEEARHSLDRLPPAFAGRRDAAPPARVPARAPAPRAF